MGFTYLVFILNQVPQVQIVPIHTNLNDFLVHQAATHLSILDFVARVNVLKRHGQSAEETQRTHF
jgi:hypothetical protein